MPSAKLDPDVAAAISFSPSCADRLAEALSRAPVAAQVDNWVYDEANSTFIEDQEMQERLMEANPNSFRKLVRTRCLCSAAAVCFWRRHWQLDGAISFMVASRL